MFVCNGHVASVVDVVFNDDVVRAAGAARKLKVRTRLRWLLRRI